MLREGIEGRAESSASLPVTSKQKWTRRVDGPRCGSACCWPPRCLCFAGGRPAIAGGRVFRKKQQELFEGRGRAQSPWSCSPRWCSGCAKAARSIKGELAGVHRQRRSPKGFGRAGLGAHRHGVPWRWRAKGWSRCFFLLAVFQQSSGWEAPVGALAGHCRVGGDRLGPVIRGGVRLDLRRFFPLHGPVHSSGGGRGCWPACCASCTKAGVWNHLQDGGVRHERGRCPWTAPVGAVLSRACWATRPRPWVGEVVVYLAFLAVALFFFFALGSPRPTASRGCGRLKPRHVFLFS